MVRRSSPVVAAAALALLLVVPSVSAQGNRWYLRLAGTYADAEGATDVPSGIGAPLVVDAAPAARVDLGYMLTLDLGIEASLVVGAHDLALVPAGGAEIDAGRLWITPATVLLTYRWPTYGDLRPYAGAGLAVAVAPYWHEPSALAALGFRDLLSDVGLGPAVAVGLDWSENDRWFLTFDLRWHDAPFDLELEGGDGARLDTVELEHDPWSVGLAVGWWF